MVIQRFTDRTIVRTKQEDENRMSDLISRQATTAHLIQRLIETANNNVGFKCDAGTIYQDAAERITTWVNEIPAQDVHPERKKGKWKMQSDPYGFFDEIPVCSACGCTTKMREKYMFCPNCGADMRGEQDE